MSECRECDRQIPETSNFCPQCGAPQNEVAARALKEFTEERARELPAHELEQVLEDSHATRTELVSRLSYVLGWVTIVVGLTLVPALASVFLLLAGIVILPPIRRLVGRAVGTTPGVAPMGALYFLGVLLAALFVWVV